MVPPGGVRSKSAGEGEFLDTRPMAEGLESAEASRGTATTSSRLAGRSPNGNGGVRWPARTEPGRTYPMSTVPRPAIAMPMRT